MSEEPAEYNAKPRKKNPFEDFGAFSDPVGWKEYEKGGEMFHRFVPDAPITRVGPTYTYFRPRYNRAAIIALCHGFLPEELN